METNLEKIKKLSKIKEDENWRFRSFLKMQDPDKIDKIVNSLNEKYTSLIDCTECGNCCTDLQPLIRKTDFAGLKKELKLDETEIKNKYLELDEDNDLRFKDLPCTFLENKKCTIYENRPHDCKSYPHLHKKEITSRLFNVVYNYSICPIVFNVYEELKFRLHFK
ncbi:MAG: YkgJ family cysteine cluster protein [Bacteroidota bacterium]